MDGQKAVDGQKDGPWGGNISKGGPVINPER